MDTATKGVALVPYYSFFLDKKKILFYKFLSNFEFSIKLFFSLHKSPTAFLLSDPRVQSLFVCHGHNGTSRASRSGCRVGSVH